MHCEITNNASAAPYRLSPLSLSTPTRLIFSFSIFYFLSSLKPSCFARSQGKKASVVPIAELGTARGVMYVAGTVFQR